MFDLVAFAPGDSITDITGQVNPGGIAANIYLVDADLAQATANAINTYISGGANRNVFVLAQESYDDATPDVRTGNFDAALTAGNITTFKNELLARFPNLTVQMLQRFGADVLTPGASRRTNIAALAARLAEL